MRSPIKLEFSEKYDKDHAREYFLKHQDGLARRLSHKRDEQLARRALALAGEPGLVLDLPCGAGRFWPLLAEKPNRVIIGADNSEAMIETACAAQPPEVVARVRPLQTSAFAIDLPDNAVDSIFCMRLFHHIGEAAHRKTILSEFQRVSRDSVILSLWVDGNFKAWRRKKRSSAAAPRPSRTITRTVCVTGRNGRRRIHGRRFQNQERLDFLPFYAMWRVYVLRKG
jgi:ubiquinone/menaquinone biosynthesis C-methylase UbiE